MALNPNARIKIVGYHQKPMAGFFRINHHQAVSRAQSLFPYFNAPGRTCSHGYIDEFGGTEQYVDTKFQAAADLDGNDVTISLETWDNGGLATHWNDKQLEAIINWDVWVIQNHPRIPIILAKSSVPGENKGLSWHRLGVPYRTTPLLALRRIATAYAPGYVEKGGVWYSKVSGKTCPGDGRIQQVKEIIYPEVAKRLGTFPVVDPIPVTPLPVPVPVPTIPQEFNMDRLDLRNAQTAPVTGRHMDNLQGLLLAAGYGPRGLIGPSGRPDGVGGPLTKYYVGEWQKRTNTGDGRGNADYLVGTGTWKSLIEY